MKHKIQVSARKGVFFVLLALSYGWAAFAQPEHFYVDAASTYDQSQNDVGTTWEKAYKDLTRVMTSDAGRRNDSIFVKVGVYKPTPTRDRGAKFVLYRQLLVFGGFPSNLTGTSTLADRPAGSRSTLSGDIGLPVLSIADIDFASGILPASFKDNCRQVLWVPDGGVNNLMDGFIIEGGYSDSEPGAGIYSTDNATFRNMEIRYNVAAGRGGGALLPRGTLTHSIVHHNRAHGGGGIDLSGGTVNNTLIHHNYTSEENGGGVRVFKGYLISSTVYGNVAADAGGGIYVDLSGGVIANTLIYGNTAKSDSKGHEVYNANTHSSGATFTHNLVKGTSQSTAIRGATNHALAVSNGLYAEANPFVSLDASAANFLHLAEASAAINVGANARVDTKGVDLAGNARVQGGVVDIGAYESAYSTSLTGVRFVGNTNVAVGATTGTLVGNLFATGVGVGNGTTGVTFQITAGNTNNTFGIDANQLKVVTSPNQTTSYNLSITATYGSSTSPASAIAIQVGTPSITNVALSGNKEVLNGAAAGTIVGTLSATGTALPPDGAGITYAITSGNTPETFEIDGDKLKIKNPPSKTTKATYNLSITATYLTATSSPNDFTIRIFGPAITGIVLSGQSVRDKAPAGTIVGILRATGTDLPVNGAGITYAITSGNTPETFQINGNVLTVKRPPDRAIKDRYSLTIRASYLNVTSSTAVFNISIMGSGTIRGVFLSKREVPNGAPVGAIIGNFIPITSNLGPDPNIIYGIKNFNAQRDTFKVEGNQLKVNKVIDNSLLHGASTLTIIASHTPTSGATLTYERLLTIIITKAKITFTAIALSGDWAVREGAPQGTTVGTFSATGQGLPANGADITYAITSGNTPKTFEIDGTELKIKTPPSISTKATYDLAITATYLGITSEPETFTIRILEPLNIPKPLNLNPFPNPANDQIHFSGYAPGATFQLRNTNGTIIQAGHLGPSLDISTLPQGRYIIEVHSAGAKARHLILKQ